MGVAMKLAMRLLVLIGAFALALQSPARAGKYDKSLAKKLKASLAAVARLGPDAYWRDPSIKTAVADIEKFGATDNAKAASLLVKIGLRSMNYPSAEVAVFTAVKKALSEMKDPGARKAIYSTLKKKRDWRVRVTLIEVLASYKGDDAAEFLLHELLDNKKTKERVVAELARTLAKRKDKRCVRPLIRAFGRWKLKGGVTLKAIQDALYEITGKSFTELQDWESFWDPREQTFNPNNAPRGPRGSTVLRKGPKLFGSEVISKKVVIIIDVSGSMHIRDPGEDKDEEAGEAGSAGSQVRKKKKKKRPAGGRPIPGDPNYRPGPCKMAKCPKPDSHDGNLPHHRMRIERAKRQLEKLVRAFSKDARFNIVQFSTTASAWKAKKVMVASDGNKNNAVAFIKNLTPSGVTQAYKALVEAFACKEADTIYFISDGSPTDEKGQPLTGGARTNLLNKVRQMNKFRKVRINTIGLKGSSPQFMRKLALMTGGKYIAVD
jgi:hypothetical protein